ncbi:Vacuolar protein sorting-associated protein 75 [[Candida] zeylanoides]
MSEAEIEASLLALAACEQEMDRAEKEAELFRIAKTQGIYRKRRDILTKIPNFWYIVLAENDDLAEYISADDLQYLEDVADIYVEHDPTNARDFTLEVKFAGASVPAQTVVKKFRTVTTNGEEVLEADAAAVEWPPQLRAINPHLVKSRTMTAEDKKNYRLGMKSLFAFFAWTGRKPGKEFRHGEELARLIVEDLFPYAVKYYTEALPGEDASESDSEEGEALDLSDDEPRVKRRRGEEHSEHSEHSEPSEPSEPSERTEA